MKIALCSDETYEVNVKVIEHLKTKGHEIHLFGALKSQKEEPWVQVTHKAAHAVEKGICDEGIFFCWTGTGACMVANKVNGIRAALCTDVETAIGARKWNKANVLVLSNRLISAPHAIEIINAWFSFSYNGEADEALKELTKIESM